jgi:hypothetical protein
MAYCVPVAMLAQAGTMQAAKTQANPSTSLTLTVDGKATALSIADLQAMPLKAVKVHNAHNNMDETYTGVALGDLLAKAGFVADKTTQSKMLHSYIRAEGTDLYWVLYAATEIEALEHTGDVVVATTMDGRPLGADGAFKLVSTEDKKPQRWVRNLTAITLKSVE